MIERKSESGDTLYRWNEICQIMQQIRRRSSESIANLSMRKQFADSLRLDIYHNSKRRHCESAVGVDLYIYVLFKREKHLVREYKTEFLCVDTLL
jgi:hypothetical protein